MKFLSFAWASSFLVSTALALPNPFIGYYSWTYGGSYGPPGANVGIVFDGNNDIATVNGDYTTGSSKNFPYPAGALKMITIGGGGTVWTSTMVNGLAANVGQAVTDGYTGIVYDIEGTNEASSTLIPSMQNLFAKTKQAGLTCVVTSAHSAPFQAATPQDAVNIVTAWVADANIDVLSPQFYSSGTETVPDTQESNQCSSAGFACWSLYKNAKAAIIPSIVDHTHYPVVQTFLAGQQVTTKGYITWAQYTTTSAPGSNPTTAATNPTTSSTNPTTSSANPTTSHSPSTSSPTGSGVCSLSYTIVSGDTCSGIASKFQISLADLYSLNPAINNPSCNNLSIGQVICVSKSVSPSTSAPTSKGPTSTPGPTTRPASNGPTTLSPNGQIKHFSSGWTITFILVASLLLALF